MGKNSEGEMMEPPHVLWPDRSRGLLPITPYMAGMMIPPDVINRKSLFSLLYKIDLDLAERTRARRCPFAGVLCIAPTICESLVVGPLICQRRLKFVSVCAAGATIVGAGYCRHRSVSGAAGCTGRRSFCWPAHSVKGDIRTRPWNG